MAKTLLKVGNCVIAEKSTRSRLGWNMSRPLLRLREIEKIISSRHGSHIPETDDGDLYIRAAALSCSEQDIEIWCRRWAPWAGPQIMLPIIAAARKRRQMMKANGIAGLLMVTWAERERLGLKTVGACDLTDEQRKALAKARKRERDRLRQEEIRRASGRKDRASHEAQSLSRTRPWEAEGISRRTWYRRRGTDASRIDIVRTGDALVPNTVSDTPVSFEKNPATTFRPAAHGPFGGTDVVGAREARAWGSGTMSPAGCQGAEPHGSCDFKSSEEAA